MSEETFVERVDRLTAQDEVDAANEVTLHLTREQAEFLLIYADGEAADCTRLVMYPFKPDAQTRKHLVLWESIYALITDAMRTKGMQ